MIESAASTPKRRWYRHSPWSLIVGERPLTSGVSLGRLVAAIVFFGLAAASPSLVHLRLDYTSGLWALATAGLLCLFVGAAIGVLMAGGRGAIAGALTAIIWLFVALAILIIAATLIANH